MMFGNPLPTINLRVDYLRPGKDTLTLVARIRRSGKTVGVVDVDVLNEAGELIAIGRANYSTALLPQKARNRAGELCVLMMGRALTYGQSLVSPNRNTEIRRFA